MREAVYLLALLSHLARKAEPQLIERLNPVRRTIEGNGGLDPTNKICYSKQCDILEWSFTAYKELSQRSAPLEVSEPERIGLSTAIRAAKAKELPCVCHIGIQWGLHDLDLEYSSYYSRGSDTAGNCAAL